VANPAVSGDVSHNDLSGVKEPVITVSIGEEPLALTSTSTTTAPTAVQ
jgi:hypothetical protein